MNSDDGKSFNLVWVTGYGGEQIQIPRAQLEESCRRSGREYPTDTSKIIWIYGERGAQLIDALAAILADVKARKTVERKVRATKCKRRASTVRTRSLFDALVIAPDDVDDAQIADAFERFAESRGWHARIRCGPHVPALIAD